jgi:two-component system sensor histidine kinase/response regulator
MREAIITEQLQELKTNLQEANEQLLEANQQLERRVQQRTAELQSAMEKLAEVNQLKANIVANISHELRTPLTHLKGYLELLLTGDMGPLTEQPQAALGIMERSSERLGRLIEDLLMFSLSEKEKLHLHLEPFSIQNLCQSCINKSQLKAKERGIRLVLDIDQGIPEVDGDMEKISWVVLQFLDNAIKFTQQGGTVTLRATVEDRLACVAVLDTGMGIPEARLDEAFDSFHQLDGSTTRRAGGTGLGLALAKKIVEAHGSIIQVSSDVGKGSSFSFSLKVH